MEDRQSIVDQVVSIVNKNKDKADYIDVRLGEGSGTVIALRKKEVEDVSKPSSFGGSVRVLHKGGWGFVSFSRMDQFEPAVTRAIEFAKEVGSDTSQLAKVPVVVDVVRESEPQLDFLKVPLAQKIKVLKDYEEIAWGVGKEIINVEINYNDSFGWKLFVSSEGSVISQEKALTYALMTITARYKDSVQSYYTGLTETNFAGLLGLNERVRLAAKTAIELAHAPAAKSGTYTVIMDQALSGVFAHEAFGHLSEADNVYENEQLRSVMELGRVFGSNKLTIYDDPSLNGLRGSFKYDDEGVKSLKTILLDKGVLVGRLHSRETAAKLLEKVNGHARAGGARAMPIVRMGVTCIAPGESTFEEMLKGIKNGLYCINWQAGNTDHERFTFTAGYAREIEDGKLGKVVRDVKLSGNLFETLKNVEMVGNDVVFKGGTCGKGGQYVPENSAAPHIKVNNVMVMGI